jgi:multidrug efflux pump subunit AcrB
LDIGKAANVTTVEMTNAVRNELEAINEEGLVGDFSVEEMFSRGDFITGAIDNGRNNVIYGGILAFFVVLLFLRNFRATLVISLAIPITMLLTFSLMWIFGYSINLISILALGLGIGMIVDASIVILESIYNKRESGMSNFKDVIQGTKEVYSAVIASMLTTVVVFLPIGLLSDDVGEFIIIMSIVVVIILVSSVLISFTLIPALFESFIKVKEKTYDQRENNISRIYTGIVSWMTAKKWRPWLVSSLFLLLFIGSIPLLMFKVPLGFMPDILDRQSEIMITLEEGTNHSEHDQIAKAIHQRLLKIIDIENYKLSSFSNEHMWLFINMTSSDNATHKQEEVNSMIISSLRSLSVDYPVSDVSFALDMGSIAYPVEVKITGKEFDQLRQLAEEIQERLEKVDGIESSEISVKELLHEKHFVLHLQAIKDAGLTPSQVREAVEDLFIEQTITKLEIDGVSTPVNILFNQQISSVNQLQQYEIETNKGSKRLSEFVGFETKQFPTDISREDGIRTVKVMAHNEDRDLGSLGRDVQRMINELHVPQGYLEQVERGEALIEACRSRIRPIFLTTLTTAFGMLPLALATGNGSNFQAPMATVVISGLLFSTMITLILIPAVYLIFEDVVNWLKKAWNVLWK